ncbi:MAG: SLBB domain-containing protein [Gemmatimonadaceae bacterium]|nr:SLBB domain-containing protein [Gemmatimonadaceae bacterium]
MPAAGFDSSRSGPTREQLQALAAQVEQEARTANSSELRAEKQRQAAAIQARLRDGDFQVGDRIALTVAGDSALNDTVVVRAGRTIQISNLPAISLQGVLHSELEGYLTKELARYLKNPKVTATALVQIAILGPVGHPGFFSLPSDMTLTDAIMLAGGPTQGGDVNKTVVRRDNQVIQSEKVVRQAFASGTTLDQLNLRAGDQIVIGEKGHHDWLRALQIGSLAAGVFVSIYAITHR